MKLNRFLAAAAVALLAAQPSGAAIINSGDGFDAGSGVGLAAVDFDVIDFTPLAANLTAQAADEELNIVATNQGVTGWQGVEVALSGATFASPAGAVSVDGGLPAGLASFSPTQLLFGFFSPDPVTAEIGDPLSLGLDGFRILASLGASYDLQFTPLGQNPIPEPGLSLLMMIGLVGLATARRRTF